MYMRRTSRRTSKKPLKQSSNMSFINAVPYLFARFGARPGARPGHVQTGLKSRPGTPRQILVDFAADIPARKWRNFPAHVLVHVRNTLSFKEGSTPQ